MSRGPRHIRVEGEHEGGEIPDYHEWVTLGRGEIRDALGRPNNNGSYRWLTIRCNNPGCPAEVLVREDDFITWATSELTPPPGRGRRALVSRA